MASLLRGQFRAVSLRPPVVRVRGLNGVAGVWDVRGVLCLGG